MTDHPTIPDPGHRAQLNAALFVTGADSGFWDDQGRPAPWPDDIDEWRSSTGDARNHEPEEQPL